MTSNQKLLLALRMKMVSSCECMTKTPDYSYHTEDCLYRTLFEADLEICRLNAVLYDSQCTCTYYGTTSFPPQPGDHVDRLWCGRCRGLGLDK